MGVGGLACFIIDVFSLCVALCVADLMWKYASFRLIEVNQSFLCSRDACVSILNTVKVLMMIIIKIKKNK